MDWKERIAFSWLGMGFLWKLYRTRENQDPKTDLYHLECKLLGIHNTYKRWGSVMPILTFKDEYLLDKYGLAKD